MGTRPGFLASGTMANNTPHDPIGQGFDQFLGFKDGHLNNYFDPLLTKQLEEVETKGYVTDIITDGALDFIKSQTEPFFCYVSYNAPHSPFQVPDTYFDKYIEKGINNKDATIYGMVENIDDNIGRIRSELFHLGKANNTLIIFMTDNGPNGLRYTNGLKGRKAQVDEGGVRVPFLMHHPTEKHWAGRKINQMAAHIDVLPTLADLLQLNTPEGPPIDGVSLIPLLNGKSLEERYFFTHQVNWEFDTFPGAIRSEEFLLTFKKNGSELYHLQNDSVQSSELSSQHPGLVSEMTQEYLQWVSEVTSSGLIPPAIETGHHIPIVELPAPDVSERVALNFQGKSGWANDWLKGWSEQSRASWKIKPVADMRYQVFFELAVRNPKNLSIEITCGSEKVQYVLNESMIAPQLPSPDLVRRGEVYERKWPLLNMGSLLIEKGTEEVVLQVKDLNSTDLEVKSIKLMPVNRERI